MACSPAGCSLATAAEQQCRFHASWLRTAKEEMHCMAVQSAPACLWLQSAEQELRQAQAAVAAAQEPATAAAAAAGAEEELPAVPKHVPVAQQPQQVQHLEEPMLAQ